MALLFLTRWLKVNCRSKSEVLHFTFSSSSSSQLAMLSVLRSRLVRHRHRSRAKLSSSRVSFFFGGAFPFFCVLSLNLYLFSRTCNFFFFFALIFLKNRFEFWSPLWSLASFTLCFSLHISLSVSVSLSLYLSR